MVVALLVSAAVPLELAAVLSVMAVAPSALAEVPLVLELRSA
jgi:hypothetical protein